MRNNVIIVTSFILFASCQAMPKSWNWGLKPRPLTGVKGFPETDTAYGQGFKEGCAIALDTVGKGLVDFLPLKLETHRLVYDQDYKLGYWDGFEQCVYIIDEMVI